MSSSDAARWRPAPRPLATGGGLGASLERGGTTADGTLSCPRSFGGELTGFDLYARLANPDADRRLQLCERF